MKASEIIPSIPLKSFSEIFDEKKKLLQEVGANESNIEAKRAGYSKIFFFDHALISLGDLVRNNGSYDFSDQEVMKINTYFSRIKEISGWLHNLDLSNPHQISNVFRNFDSNIEQSGILKNLEIRAEGRNVSNSRSIIDMYIDDIESIIKFLELSVLFNKKDIDEFEKSLKNISDNVSNANDLAGNLLKNKDKIEEAQKSADNWLLSLDKSISATLEKRSLNFANKAEEHKTFTLEYVPISLFKKIKILNSIRQPSLKGKFYWLIAAFLFAVVSFGIVISFIVELKRQVGHFTRHSITKNFITDNPFLFSIFLLSTIHKS